MHSAQHISYQCLRGCGPLYNRESDLVCQSCQAQYPVIDGIPRFIQGEDYGESFGFQWRKHYSTQLDSYSGLPISRNRFFSSTKWDTLLDGQKVLEAGSGAGRFTEILLSTGAEVYTFDLSRAVEANHRNNGNNPRLHLFQASIYDIPLPQGSFDKVLCLGVLQHTPDPKQAFFSLVSFVKPGGEIVIDVYKKTISSFFQWKYLLRPILKRCPSKILYRGIRASVAILLPLAIAAGKVFGSLGARLFPISSYPRLGLPYALHKEWSILDTFDMYSPTYDFPQTLRSVRRWLEEAGLQVLHVEFGANGIVARGCKPVH